VKEFLKKVGCSIPIIIYIGLLVFSVSSMFTSCNKPKEVKVDDSYYLEDYNDGYDEGYDEGYYEGYYEGYDEGHYDGIYYDWEENIHEIAVELEYDAIHYAVENGGWHPEEAWMIIEAYQNNEPFYKDGSPPSKQDYFDAIDSLIYFYDYFYSARYE
jgi:hypothetical protein